MSVADAPVSFTVDCDCGLKILDDLVSTARHSRHRLEIDEVAQRIMADLGPCLSQCRPGDSTATRVFLLLRQN